MKYLKRLLSLLLIMSGFVCLFSCSTKSNDNKKEEVERINLNIAQADLISSFTDNLKYLNKKYLYTIEDLDDSDIVNIIVTLDHKGLVDSYTKEDLGLNSFSDYANDSFTTKKIQKMEEEQQQIITLLKDSKLIKKVNHSFTTLFNGFSAQTTYGQFKQLVNSKYDLDVTISEVYSKPNTTVQSSDGKNAVVNYVDVYETGIFNSSNVKYNGENTAVAILDSGFDIHHTVFQNMPNSPMITRNDVDNVLYESKAYGYHQNIKVQDVFINDKIPFVYDYADKDPDVAPFDSNHGTHVAGIIGGKDDVITGVAVNTQLVLMKVFGDVNNGAVQDDILAALEDALLLGVDAINLSLGSACGFARSSDNEYINVVYDKIEAAGISLVVAASNDYSSGYGGENSNTNKASNPDSATVGSPGSYASTISVASISGVKSKYIETLDGHTFFFNNANNNAGEPYDFYDMLFDALDVNKSKIELEYVTVPGVGKRVNYTNIDVRGKIALVKRGDTSFEEKAQVALSQGAIGCIIYNNIAGDVFMNAGSHLEIALCSISKDDGEYLASKSSGKLVLDKSYLAGPFMSEFSSWGPISDLSLKPEITAHGGTILSSVPGGGYDEISGTSMACPNLCGVIILVRQALKERYPDISTVELNNMTNSLLMSTATVVLDESGNPYSPRKQGSGLGNLQYAIDTLAYLSVEGSTKPKLELKDDPEETGIYELVFDVKNISDSELKYNLKNLTMTESLSSSDPKYVAEKAYMLNPNTDAEVTGDGSIENGVVTVKAGGVATIKYTLKLTAEEKAYIRKSFINGIYVEGFAVLESLNADGIDLSIPFLAFFGDWTVAPMFDKTYFEVESEAYNGAIDEEDKLKADYYATTPLATYYHSYVIPMGTYVYEMDETMYDPIPASIEHCAIGYGLETLNGITTVYAGLLRNTKKMTTIITNSETGEVVYEHIKYDEHKAYFSGSIIPGYDMINVDAASLGLQNNTKYTLTMVAELDYDDGGLSDNLNNTFEFSFYIDYQAPIITNAEFYHKYDKSLKDNRYYVDVYVYDNHYAQAIRPFTIVDGKMVNLTEYVIPIYGEKGEVNKVTIEITDYIDLLKYGVLEDGTFKISNGLGFLVDDYALNQSYSFVSLPGTNSNSISYKEDYYSTVNNGTYQFHKDIYVGDELDLTKMLTSNDPTISSDIDAQSKYFSNLNWTSSDESIIKVKNGQLEAISSGTAIITCATMAADGYEYKINLRIRVKNKNVTETTSKLTDIEFTYFETLKAFIDGPEISEVGETGDKLFFTEKPFISCYPSEKFKLGYELEPWNLKDYELIWSSTNDKVATVDSEGVVTALKEGSATITLKVKIDGRTSALMASARIVVKNEFIVEGNTLVAYKGLGGDVVIPDDEGILYIGTFAFSLYTTDYEIEIEDENYDDAKTPSSNDSITSITIPAEVKEVQNFAFYNCTNLETVNFLKNDEGVSCSIIRQYAFYGNKNLKNINLENIEVIGEGAFENCTSLVDIDLKSNYALGDYAFRNCTNLKYADITALRNGGLRAFENCTNLTTITNGEFTNFAVGMFNNSGITRVDFYADRIPSYCFINCINLTDVVIHNSVVYVGANSFENCSNLTNVIFEDGCESEFIYQQAFKNCTNLSRIVLPDSEVIIENEAFENCKKLVNVEFNTNTLITKNLGNIFKNCSNLSRFIVSPNNIHYTVDHNLLLSRLGDEILLAAPGYEYEDYQIPESIVRIGKGAFSGIYNLLAVEFSDNVTEIDSYAFYGCDNLVSIKLNDNVTINEYAFSNCKSLRTITNIDTIKYFAPYVFANCNLTNLTIVESVTIDEGAFSNNTLENINIMKDSIINDRAFSNNTLLETINIISSKIGKYAFSNCVNLANIYLPNTLIIDDYAFLNCSSISHLDLPSATNINNYAFSNCSNLTQIYLNNIVSIGDCAFSIYNNGKSNLLETITLPNTLKNINEYAFAYSSNLKHVNIDSNNVEIGSFAFSHCSLLEDVIVSGSVETIKEGTFEEAILLHTFDAKNILYIEGAAFYNCNALANINLENVREIGMQAFERCVNLTSVNLPNVIKLDSGAFLSATNLETVNMPKVEYLGEQALSCIGVSEIKLPNTVKYIAPTIFNYNQKMTKITDYSGNDTVVINDYIRVDEGVLYTTLKDNKLVLNTYPTAKENDTYEVLFGTIRIDSYAGYFNDKIKKLIFPDTLELIGNMAFYGSVRLKEVEFRSTSAPILEGTINMLDLEYEASTEIYKYLNKYFQFNGYFPLHYGQFKDMIGTCDKFNISLSKNADISSYQNELYKLYFNVDQAVITEYEALNDYSIDYINKALKVPTNVSLNDEHIIKDARTAYNLVNQDLTKYGYSQDFLDELESNLSKAEKDWNLILMNRINKVYSHIISDINSLGSNYQFDKINDYYRIVESLEIIDREDKKYIDTTNVDNFKKGFDEYFKSINEDINVINEISTLPTSTVNKVGLALAATTSILLVALLVVLKKRMFL